MSSPPVDPKAGEIQGHKENPSVLSRRIVGASRVGGRGIDIRQTTWSDGHLSYDLIENGQVLTPEDTLKTYPADTRRIRHVLADVDGTYQALTDVGLALNQETLRAPLKGIDLTAEEARLLLGIAAVGGDAVPQLAGLLAKVRQAGLEEGAEQALADQCLARIDGMELVCPHCGARDQIVEVDSCTRYNPIVVQAREDGTTGLAVKEEDRNFSTERFQCQRCGEQVNLPLQPSWP